MPWSPEHAVETRQRILDAASAAFRRRGLAATSVADVMKDAGLTHGGFYAHFASKDDLLAEALGHGRRQTNERFEGFDSMAAVVNSYLSASHAAHPERGCSIPSLGSEIVRANPKARRRLAEGIRARIARLRELLPGRLSRADRDRQAIGAFACMVGGLLLARSVDKSEAGHILESCRAFLHETIE